MAEKVTLQKTSFKNDSFTKVVKTEFTTYVPVTPQVDTDTVAELFRLFDKLFYDIPVYGPSNSLEALVKKSSELYETPETPAVIRPLLDEIAELRQRLLEANEQILELTRNG